MTSDCDVHAPQERAGLPIRRWMHETHMGPALVSVLDLAGHQRRARHTLSGRLSPAQLVAAACAYGAAYTVLCHGVARQTLAWPYPFMGRLSGAGRLMFSAASAALLSMLTLLSRHAILWRESLARTNYDSKSA